eukprot:916647-Rhodomonas_salina.3
MPARTHPPEPRVFIIRRPATSKFWTGPSVCVRRRLGAVEATAIRSHGSKPFVQEASAAAMAAETMNHGPAHRASDPDADL